MEHKLALQYMCVLIIHVCRALEIALEIFFSLYLHFLHLFHFLHLGFLNGRSLHWFQRWFRDLWWCGFCYFFNSQLFS